LTTAAQMPEYQNLVDDAIKFAKETARYVHTIDDVLLSLQCDIILKMK